MRTLETAARRIHDACEAIAGAREFNGGGLGGRAFWQVGGPTAMQVQAATDLRDMARVLGRAHERAVLLLWMAGVAHGDLLAARSRHLYRSTMHVLAANSLTGGLTVLGISAGAAVAAAGRLNAGHSRHGVCQ